MITARVGILMGSDSDLPVMRKASEVLKEMGVDCEMDISSAHRLPERTAEYARTARERGIEILICGAGMAAHLAGVVAADTTLPVIGVPMPGGALNGVDALYSTVQMPGGIPVATMAIGKAGAKNAGIFAVQVLALADAGLAVLLHQYREEMEREVAAKDAALQV